MPGLTSQRSETCDCIFSIERGTAVENMKWVDLRQTIRKTRVSFIAVILFVGMSVGTLLGTNWSGPAVAHLANDYYDEHSVPDLTAASASGFTPEAVEAVRALDDTLAVEGGYSADAFLSEADGGEMISVSSVSEAFNHLEVLSGKLPQAPDEIALEQETADAFGYELGDTIELNSSLEALTGFPVSALKEQAFTVTALVHHPVYTSVTPGTAKGFSTAYRKAFYYYGVVDESAFNELLYAGSYNSLLIRCKSLEGLDRFAADYSAALADAGEELRSGVEDGDSWLITDLTSTYGYYTVKMANETGGKIASILATFFFLIGLLVCYSTVLRIVEEEKRLIGTKMANGFSRETVTSKYVWYVLTAVTFGIILGIGNAFLISVAAQTGVTFSLTYSGTYSYYNLAQVVGVTAFEYIAMVIAALLASRRQTKRRITNLLTDSKENSRLFTSLSRLGIVKKAPVSVQSFIYNITMDSSRVFATLVGMVGSMALLIAPLSLHTMMQTAPRIQYETNFLFTHAIRYTSEESGDEVAALLDEKGAAYARVYMEDWLMPRENGPTGSVRLIVTDDQKELERLVKLREPETGKEQALGSDGIWLWSSEQKDYGTEAGDIVKLSSYDGGSYSFTVSGLYESFDSTAYRVFMTKQVYEAATGREYVENGLLTNIPESTAETIRDMQGVSSCVNERKNCEDYYANSAVIVFALLGVFLVLSAIIAFMILLNLNIQFVQEKKNEMIVMRINGFSVGAAKMYIMRDNIFLSLIAVVLGAGAGILLAGMMINAIQMEGQSFPNSPSLPACLIGAGITLLYMLITTWIAVRPIGKLDLTDISKV